MWRVNGTQVGIGLIDDSHGIDDDVPPPDPDTGIRHVVLRVPAIVINNGSRVQCVGVGDVEVTSPEVTLLIQGE